MTRWFPSIVALAMLGACDSVEDGNETENEEEVITTVVLTFAPNGGGADVVATWADPEDDGNPVIDAITLSDAEDYTLSVEFFNELEEEPEDITEEIADEDDEHQIFFTGSAVQSPATGANAEAVVTQMYDDMDGGGLPVGLENTITTDATGSGTFTVTLRHLPPESGEAVKVDGLAEDVAAGGLASIAGDTDISVDFDLTVN